MQIVKNNTLVTAQTSPRIICRNIYVNPKINHECLSKSCHGCQFSARLCALLWVPKRRIETYILVGHTYIYCHTAVYISLYIYICMYVWNILCLLTGGTRPKYWSRFSGAQCQNGNNANSIIIILIGAQTEAGVSRMEYYIIYIQIDIV